MVYYWTNLHCTISISCYYNNKIKLESDGQRSQYINITIFLFGVHNIFIRCLYKFAQYIVRSYTNGYFQSNMVLFLVTRCHICSAANVQLSISVQDDYSFADFGILCVYTTMPGLAPGFYQGGDCRGWSRIGGRKIVLTKLVGKAEGGCHVSDPC